MERVTRFLFCAGMLLSAPHALGQSCPENTVTGSVTSGDGSTIPGLVSVYMTGCRPHCYVGSFPPGAISFPYIAQGDFETEFYAGGGGYFFSPIGGRWTCVQRKEPPYCTLCSGGFGLSLFATQGAIEGRLSLVPPAEAGLLGTPIFAYAGGGYGGTTTDADGHFEFRARSEPARSNNWGVGVDPKYDPWPHSGMGSRTYVLGYGPLASPLAEASVTVASSQLAGAALIARNPRVDDQEIRSCPAVGQPVSVVTGNVFFDQTDAELAGVVGLAFVRGYNSRNGYRYVGSPFGWGWSHSYGRTLSVVGTRSLDFRGDDGVAVYYYDADGDGTFEPALPATERSRVVREPDGSFTRHLLGGARELFDAAGRLASLVDASGNVVTLGRDSLGRLATVSDPGGRGLTLGYDTLSRIVSLAAGEEVLARYTYTGDLLSAVDYPDGSGYGFSYDGVRRLLEVRDHSGRVVERHSYGSDALAGHALSSEIADGQERYSLAYDEGGRKTTVTDALGNVTSYTWAWVSGRRYVTKTEGPCPSCSGGGETREWSYDAQGRVLSETDALGHVTSYGYDEAGNRVLERDALGQETRLTFDAEGRVLTRLEPDGGLVSYSYGPAGPLTITEKVTEAESRTTRFSYDERGQPTTVSDPLGATTTFSYSASGDLVAVTDPLGQVSTFGYDALGRRTSATDALGQATTTSYDGAGRILRVTLPDGTHSDFSYDLGGRRTAVSDALGRTTRYAYDAYGRLESVSDPLGGVTGYAYDAMSRLSGLTDANGHTTGFEYDGFGRVSRVQYLGGGAETFSYDAAGRLATKTNRRGVVTSYTYDALGRLVGKAYSDGSPAASYAYDAVGRLLTGANGADTLRFTYDLAGQLVTEASTLNASLLGYRYDAAGRRVARTLDGVTEQSEEYDPAGRLRAITSTVAGLPGPQRFTFDYDGANRRTRLAYPNGVMTSYTYDPASRLTSLEHAATGGLVAFSRYGYDAAGNRTSKATEAFAEGYSYDALDRLTAVTRDGTPSEAYSYDAVGNRLTALGAPSWSYDEANRLLSDGRATYSYDANGNLTTRQETSGTWSYLWDAENRLSRVLLNGTERLRFAYDALGRRVEVVRMVQGVPIAERLLYDGEDIVWSSRSGERTPYLHGPGIDEPLASLMPLRPGFGPELVFYQADGLGSLVKTTDSLGLVVTTRRYDAWGNLQLGQTRSGYAFTGREWDRETGLYYYRARYYDPKVGRFISEDPIGFEGGDNFYAYVEDAPTNKVDPSGLESGRTFTDLWKNPGPNERMGPPYPPYTCEETCGIKLRNCNLLHGPPAFAAGVLCRYVCKIGAPTFRVVCSVICTAGATSTAQSEFLRCYAKYKECMMTCKPPCGTKQ